MAPRRKPAEETCTCTGCGSLFKAPQISIAKRSVLHCGKCVNAQGPKAMDPCPFCGLLWNGARGVAAHIQHSHPLESYKDLKFKDKIEDVHYVVCKVCGFKGKTLASHLRLHNLNATSYLKRYPEALIRSKELKEKRKSAISKSWKEASRKGKTKSVVCPGCGELHEASMFLAFKMHDLRCKECQRTGKEIEETTRFGNLIELEDFVSCGICGYRAESLMSHLQTQHPKTDYKTAFPGFLVVSKRSLIRNKDSLRLNLTRKDLEPFMDSKKRVITAAAAEYFKCAKLTIRNYCKELGVPTCNRLAFQRYLLDRLSQILGGSSYEWEYSDPEIRNPKTNYVFRYDGFFPEFGLLVEAHGAQHEKFIPYWHKTKENFKRRVLMDQIKIQKAKDKGYKLLVVFQTDPKKFDDENLRNRLKKLGIPCCG